MPGGRKPEAGSRKLEAGSWNLNLEPGTWQLDEVLLRTVDG